mgnify:CR=1 FL=1
MVQKKAFKEFNHNSEFLSHLELASGHINDTYLIKTVDKPYFVLYLWDSPKRNVPLNHQRLPGSF